MGSDAYRLVVTPPVVFPVPYPILFLLSKNGINPTQTKMGTRVEAEFDRVVKYVCDNGTLRNYIVI